jgi:hypothetical protein
MPRSRSAASSLGGAQLELMEPGDRTAFITLDMPSRATDGDGGYAESTFRPLVPPSMYAQVVANSADMMTRVFGAGLEATATDILLLPYHPTVKVGARVTLNGRFLWVQGVRNVGELNLQTALACQEIVS